MLRNDFNPLHFLLGILFAVGLAVITRTPVAHPIKSLDETYKISEELGYQWTEPGVPIIVFTRSSCPHSNALEAELHSHGVRYLRVDVNENEVGRALHAQIGRNYLGTTATRATPTTVIGTAVIRGNDIAAILVEIATQNQGN